MRDDRPGEEREAGMGLRLEDGEPAAYLPHPGRCRRRHGRRRLAHRRRRRRRLWLGRRRRQRLRPPAWRKQARRRKRLQVAIQGDATPTLQSNTPPPRCVSQGQVLRASGDAFDALTGPGRLRPPAALRLPDRLAGWPAARHRPRSRDSELGRSTADTRS